MKSKNLVFVLWFMLMTLLMGNAEEVSSSPEMIWMGRGSYIYNQPEGRDLIPGDIQKIDIKLWIQGTEKFFTFDGDKDTRYYTYKKNPDYNKSSNKYFKGFEYIIETEKYGNVYVNPDLNGNPLDYYSSAKMEELGIVYPVTANAVKKNANGELVHDSTKETLRLTLYRIGDTDDYYAMYGGKKYEISDSPAPKTYLKNDDIKYYSINYNGTKYIFKFKKY